MMLDEIESVTASAECLYSTEAVSVALRSMATEINATLKDQDLIVLCVMNGGLITTAQLIPHLTMPLQVDYIHPTRYQGSTSGGVLDWIVHPSENLKDKTVLIVDDILDEGVTLQEVLKACHSMGVKKALTAVLVRKQHDRNCGIEADFVGLTVEDRYVFGSGMDYKGYLRNLAGIWAI